MVLQQTRTHAIRREPDEFAVRLGRALVFVVTPSVAAGALLLAMAIGLARLLA